MKRILLSAAMSSAAAIYTLGAIPAPAHAHGPQFGPPFAGSAEMVPPPIPGLHGLKLSEEQRDKHFKVMHAAAPKLHAQFKALRQAEQALRAQTLAETAEPAALQAHADAIGRAWAGLALIRAELDRQILALLTSEQRRQWQQFPLPERLPQ